MSKKESFFQYLFIQSITSSNLKSLKCSDNSFLVINNEVPVPIPLLTSVPNPIPLGNRGNKREGVRNRVNNQRLFHTKFPKGRFSKKNDISYLENQLKLKTINSQAFLLLFTKKEQLNWEIPLFFTIKFNYENSTKTNLISQLTKKTSKYCKSKTMESYFGKLLVEQPSVVNPPLPIPLLTPFRGLEEQPKVVPLGKKGKEVKRSTNIAKNNNVNQWLQNTTPLKEIFFNNQKLVSLFPKKLFNQKLLKKIPLLKSKIEPSRKLKNLFSLDPLEGVSDTNFEILNSIFLFNKKFKKIYVNNVKNKEIALFTNSFVKMPLQETKNDNQTSLLENKTISVEKKDNLFEEEVKTLHLLKKETKRSIFLDYLTIYRPYAFSVSNFKNKKKLSETVEGSQAPTDSIYNIFLTYKKSFLCYWLLPFLGFVSLTNFGIARTPSSKFTNFSFIISDNFKDQKFITPIPLLTPKGVRNRGLANKSNNFPNVGLFPISFAQNINKISENKILLLPLAKQGENQKNRESQLPLFFPYNYMITESLVPLCSREKTKEAKTFFFSNQLLSHHLYRKSNYFFPSYPSLLDFQFSKNQQYFLSLYSNQLNRSFKNNKINSLLRHNEECRTPIEFSKALFLKKFNFNYSTVPKNPKNLKEESSFTFSDFNFKFLNNKLKDQTFFKWYWYDYLLNTIVPNEVSQNSNRTEFCFVSPLQGESEAANELNYFPNKILVPSYQERTFKENNSISPTHFFNTEKSTFNKSEISNFLHKFNNKILNKTVIAKQDSVINKFNKLASLSPSYPCETTLPPLGGRGNVVSQKRDGVRNRSKKRDEKKQGEEARLCSISKYLIGVSSSKFVFSDSKLLEKQPKDSISQTSLILFSHPSKTEEKGTKAAPPKREGNVVSHGKLSYRKRALFSQSPLSWRYKITQSLLCNTMKSLAPTPQTKVLKLQSWKNLAKTRKKYLITINSNQFIFKKLNFKLSLIKKKLKKEKFNTPYTSLKKAAFLLDHLILNDLQFTNFVGNLLKSNLFLYTEPFHYSPSSLISSVTSFTEINKVKFDSQQAKTLHENIILLLKESSINKKELEKETFFSLNNTRLLYNCIFKGLKNSFNKITQSAIGTNLLSHSSITESCFAKLLVEQPSVVNPVPNPFRGKKMDGFALQMEQPKVVNPPLPFFPHRGMGKRAVLLKKYATKAPFLQEKKEVNKILFDKFEKTTESLRLPILKINLPILGGNFTKNKSSFLFVSSRITELPIIDFIFPNSEARRKTLSLTNEGPKITLSPFTLKGYGTQLLNLSNSFTASSSKSLPFRVDEDCFPYPERVRGGGSKSLPSVLAVPKMYSDKSLEKQIIFPNQDSLGLQSDVKNQNLINKNKVVNNRRLFHTQFLTPSLNEVLLQSKPFRVQKFHKISKHNSFLFFSKYIELLTNNIKLGLRPYKNKIGRTYLAMTTFPYQNNTNFLKKAKFEKIFLSYLSKSKLGFQVDFVKQKERQKLTKNRKVLSIPLKLKNITQNKLSPSYFRFQERLKYLPSSFCEITKSNMKPVTPQFKFFKYNRVFTSPFLTALSPSSSRDGGLKSKQQLIKNKGGPQRSFLMKLKNKLFINKKRNNEYWGTLIDHSQESIEIQNKIQESRRKKQHLKLKRRLKKMQCATRRRKKRKIFYPRPKWLTFSMYEKFLNLRFINRQTILANTEPYFPHEIAKRLKWRSTSFSLPLRNNVKEQPSSLVAFGCCIPIPLLTPKGVRKKGDKLQQLKTPFFPLSLPLQGNRVNILTPKGVRTSSSNKFIKTNGVTQKIDGVKVGKGTEREKINSWNQNSKDFYTISHTVSRDLRRILMKSNWLRNYLNPYLEKIKYIYNEMENDSKKITLLKNLRYFILSLYGSFFNLNQIDRVTKQDYLQIAPTTGKDYYQNVNPFSSFLFSKDKSLSFDQREIQEKESSLQTKTLLPLWGTRNNQGTWLLRPLLENCVTPPLGGKQSKTLLQNEFKQYNSILNFEYNRILYQRIQRLILNIRDNLNINGQIKNRSKKLGKNVRPFIKREYTKRDINIPANQNENIWGNILKKNILKLSRSFGLLNKGYEEPSLYTIGGASQNFIPFVRNNLHWALNKTENFSNSNSSGSSYSKKLWEKYKIREINKNNKTKKMIFEIFMKYNNLLNDQNSLDEYTHLLESDLTQTKKLYKRHANEVPHNIKLNQREPQRFFYEDNINITQFPIPFRVNNLTLKGIRLFLTPKGVKEFPIVDNENNQQEELHEIQSSNEIMPISISEEQGIASSIFLPHSSTNPLKGVNNQRLFHTEFSREQELGKQKRNSPKKRFQWNEQNFFNEFQNSDIRSLEFLEKKLLKSETTNSLLTSGGKQRDGVNNQRLFHTKFSKEQELGKNGDHSNELKEILPKSIKTSSRFSTKSYIDKSEKKLINIENKLKLLGLYSTNSLRPSFFYQQKNALFLLNNSFYQLKKKLSSKTVFELISPALLPLKGLGTRLPILTSLAPPLGGVKRWKKGVPTKRLGSKGLPVIPKPSRIQELEAPHKQIFKISPLRYKKIYFRFLKQELLKEKHFFLPYNFDKKLSKFDRTRLNINKTLEQIFFNIKQNSLNNFAGIKISNNIQNYSKMSNNTYWWTNLKIKLQNQKGFFPLRMEEIPQSINFNINPSSTLISLLFHFCTLISFISLGGVRSVIKFYYILLSKTYKIINKLRFIKLFPTRVQKSSFNKLSKLVLTNKTSPLFETLSLLKEDVLPLPSTYLGNPASVTSSNLEELGVFPKVNTRQLKKQWLQSKTLLISKKLINSFKIIKLLALKYLLSFSTKSNVGNLHAKIYREEKEIKQEVFQQKQLRAPFTLFLTPVSLRNNRRLFLSKNNQRLFFLKRDGVRKWMSIRTPLNHKFRKKHTKTLINLKNELKIILKLFYDSSSFLIESRQSEEIMQLSNVKAPSLPKISNFLWIKKSSDKFSSLIFLNAYMKSFVDTTLLKNGFNKQKKSQFNGVLLQSKPIPLLTPFRGLEELRFRNGVPHGNRVNNQRLFHKGKKIDGLAKQQIEKIKIFAELHYNLHLSVGLAFVHKVSFYTYLLLLKSVDILAAPALLIYKFFEKPGEYVVENLAYSFLLEWSADLISTIPDTLDTSIAIYFSKINRNLPFYFFINTNIGIPFANILISMTKFSKLIFSTFLFGINNSIIRRLTNSSLLLFIQQLSEPDLDYINRQKKGIIFWDIWGECLKTIAEENAVNIYELSTDKEEQLKLLSNIERVEQLKFLKNKVTEFSKNQKSFVISHSFNRNAFVAQKDFVVKAKLNPLGSNKLASLPLYPFYFFIPSIFWLRSKTTLRNNQGTWLLRPHALQPYRGGLGKRVIEKSSNLVIKSLLGLNLKSEIKYKPDRWSVNQFLNYQGKDTDLFIDLHPPRTFLTAASSLKYSFSVQAPIGSIVCQIFAGIFYKQISKNILVVLHNSNQNNKGLEKSLLIQAIAGETELKIITDNAHRYAMVIQGVAVGIKLLKDVFEALCAAGPCLFLMEDIHAIGQRRPFLIDEASPNLTESIYNKNQSMQGFLLKEKSNASREILYKTNKHLLTNYKKPYKEFKSLASNHFSFTFLYRAGSFTKIRTSEIKSAEVPLSIQVSKKENESKLTEKYGSSSSLSSFTSKGLGDSKKGKEDFKNGFKSIKSLKTTPFEFDSQTLMESAKIENKTNVYSSFSLLIDSLKTKQSLINPPASSPFNLLLMKEATKLKHNQNVREMSWFGLPGEQYSLISKSNYSIRVKVALLADLVLSNLAVKLEMITDLLVIIDSVKGNRGFVIFATTHLPDILDPALRRPGRFDETISLPLIPALYSRWTNYRYNVQYLTSSLFKNYSIPLNSTFNKGTTLDLSKYPFCYTDSQLEALFPIYSSTINYISQKQRLMPFSSFLKNKSFFPLINQKSQFGYPYFASKGGKRKQSKEDRKKQKIKTEDQQFVLLSSKGENEILLCNQGLRYQIVQNLLQIFYSRTTSYASHSIISLMLYSSQTKLNNAKLNPSKKIKTEEKRLTLKWPTMLKESKLNNSFIENYSIYLSLFGCAAKIKFNYGALLPVPKVEVNNQNDFGQIIFISFIASKLGESFGLSSNLKKQYSLRPLFPLSSLNIQKPEISNQKKKINNPNPFLFNFNKNAEWKNGSSLLYSYIQKRLPYFEKTNLKSNLNFLTFYSSKLLNFNNKYSLMEAPSPPISNILLPAKRYENYKRTFSNLYNLNFETNKTNGRVSEKIKLHQQQRLLKRLYNYPIKEFFRNEKISSFSFPLITSSVPLSHPSTVKLRYSLSIKDGKGVRGTTFGYSSREKGERSSPIPLLTPKEVRNRGEEVKLNFDNIKDSSQKQSHEVTHNTNLNLANFTQSYLVFAEIENLAQKDFAALNQFSSLDNSYRNILYNRHRTYLTNQWWNGQQGEHNSETTFLSDIDWRYTQISKIKSNNDIQVDFPDCEQFYNPRNRRWILTKGDWNYWFNIETDLKDIYSHYIYDSFAKAYKYLDQNREILDLYSNNLLKSSFNLLTFKSIVFPPFFLTPLGVSRGMGKEQNYIATENQSKLMALKLKQSISFPDLNQREILNLYKRFFYNIFSN